MKARKGTLRGEANDRLPLHIKRLPTVFDDVFYSVGFHLHSGEWVSLRSYSRERDARRALRSIGYTQEGNRWVAAETVELRCAHAD